MRFSDKITDKKAQTQFKQAESLFRYEIRKEDPDDGLTLAFVKVAIVAGAKARQVFGEQPSPILAGILAKQFLDMLPSPENVDAGGVLPKNTRKFLLTKRSLWRQMLFGFHFAEQDHEKEMFELGLALMQVSLFDDEQKDFEEVLEEYYRECMDRPWLRNNIAKLIPQCEGYCKSIAFRQMFIFLLRVPNDSYLSELIRFNKKRHTTSK